jgi:hypothetical protein
MTLSVRKPLVAVFALLMMVAMTAYAPPAQAACAQDNTKTNKFKPKHLRYASCLLDYV